MPVLIGNVYAPLSLAAILRSPASKPAPNLRCRSALRSRTITSFVLRNGKKLKMLKRHLMTRCNMTPEQYRQRLGPWPTIPMVAPAYAEKRRELAKNILASARKPCPQARRSPSKAAG
jgi:predicted transcriptional regulator